MACLHGRIAAPLEPRLQNGGRRRTLPYFVRYAMAFRQAVRRPTELPKPGSLGETTHTAEKMASIRFQGARDKRNRPNGGRDGIGSPAARRFHNHAVLLEQASEELFHDRLPARPLQLGPAEAIDLVAIEPKLAIG
jgi:hypothetical protein